MGEEVKLEVIKTTQNSLSKYIKKPPLTEKLLRKPPFRYLHDITTAVMRETGYLQGLYTQDELNPENIKDREAKIAFLEKLIAAVNLSAGVKITARPNKIVAGLDVAKTNELLQAIAKALDKKVDSSKAVEEILHKKNKGGAQQKKNSTTDRPNKEKKAADTKSHDSRVTDTLKKKTKDKTNNVEKPESRRTKQSKDTLPTKPSKIVVNSKESPIQESKEVKNQEKENDSKVSEQFDIEKPPMSQNVPDTEKLHDPEPKHDVKPPPHPHSEVTTNQTPSEHKEKEEDEKEEKKEKSRWGKPLDKPDGLERSHGHSKELEESQQDNFKEQNVDLEEDLKRPQSARAVHRKKGPKKPNVSSEVISKKEETNKEILLPEKQLVKPNHFVTTDAKQLQQETYQSESVGVVPKESKRPRTAARPASARPGAPRVRDRGTIVLKETDNKEVSEPVNLIVDSKDLPKDDDETLVMVEAPSTETVVDQVVDESHLLSGDQGHLVSQILETQKELEENAASESVSESFHKIDVSWSSGRQEAVTREVERLRSSIQALTRAVNPLGKLIDFLQEDVESMQVELENWVATNQQLSQQLQAEQRLTEECTEPLARQLEDIEQLVEEQLEEMSVVKAAIIRNDERLTRLLRGTTSRVPG